jgi:uncharacterized membrane protein YjjP (DUF1212 family)
MYNREQYQRLASKQNFEGSHTCITLNAIPFSLSSQQMFFDSATGIDIYSLQGIDVDKVMESNNLLIRHKHDKEISVIE